MTDFVNKNNISTITYKNPKALQSKSGYAKPTIDLKAGSKTQLKLALSKLNANKNQKLSAK